MVSAALEEHGEVADDPEVVAAAKAMRNRLRERQRKERQRARRELEAHTTMSQALHAGTLQAIPAVQPSHVILGLSLVCAPLLWRPDSPEVPGTSQAEKRPRRARAHACVTQRPRRARARVFVTQRPLGRWTASVPLSAGNASSVTRTDAAAEPSQYAFQLQEDGHPAVDVLLSFNPGTCGGFSNVGSLSVGMATWQVYESEGAELMLTSSMGAPYDDMRIFGTLQSNGSLIGYATSWYEIDQYVAINASLQGESPALSPTCSGKGHCELDIQQLYRCRCREGHHGDSCQYTANDTLKYYVHPSQGLLEAPAANGSAAAPFDSLRAALEGTNETQMRELWLLPGVYLGINNTELHLTSTQQARSAIPLPQKPLRLASMQGPNTTVIDCEGMTWFMRVHGDEDVFAGADLVLEGLTIRNCTYSDPSGYGSAVQAFSFTSPLRLRRVVLHSHLGIVGAIHVSRCSHVEVAEAVLVNNTALVRSDGIQSGGKGGAVTCESSNVDLVDTVLSGNVASKYGGAIAVNGDAMHFDATLSLLRVVIRGNMAMQMGGGIYMFCTGYSSFTHCAVLANRVLHQDDVDDAAYHPHDQESLLRVTSGSGGGIMAVNSHCQIDDIVMSRNTAINFGGAIRVESESSVSLNRVIIENNTCSKGSGGGLSITTTQCLFSRIQFSQNAATEGGGALDATQSSIFGLDLFEATGNDAYFGGGMYLHGTTWSQAPAGIMRLANNSGGSGGAVHLTSNSHLHNITGAVLTGNTATLFGGAMVVSRKCTAEMIGAVVADNTAGNVGGAMYIHGESELYGCAFERNQATEGGAIGFLLDSGSKQSIVKNCSFVGNRAENDGAVFFVHMEDMDHGENSTEHDDMAHDDMGNSTNATNYSACTMMTQAHDDMGNSTEHDDMAHDDMDHGTDEHSSHHMGGAMALPRLEALLVTGNSAGGGATLLFMQHYDVSEHDASHVISCTNCSILNNSAAYVNEEGYAGNFLQLKVASGEEGLAQQEESGVPLRQPFLINLTDVFNLTVATENSQAVVAVMPSSECTISGSAREIAFGGVVTFQDVVLTGQPGVSCAVHFETQLQNG
ncbi:hypothetical protein CYMTET_46358, partial [Cymbomonas tetramitiformis]